MKQALVFFQKPWIYVLIIIIGVSLKFYHLNYKIFWEDEINTVLQTGGANTLFDIDPGKDGEIQNVDFYHDMLRHSVRDKNLAAELKQQVTNMNLNPLHYAALSFWYRIVGDDLIHYRLFSVMVFILSLPFMFFLTKKLFSSDLAAWIATSLYSISPYIHIFAQEARYYIFWTFLLLVLHFFLVYALHMNKTSWWIGYSLAALLSLYASTLSGFIILEHLVFVLIFYKSARLKITIALAVAGLIYAPWFIFILNNYSQVESSLSWHKMPEQLPFWAPLLGIVLGYIRTFSFYESYTLYWDDVFANITPSMVLETFLNLLILVTLIFAFIRLFKSADKKSAWFVTCIILPGFIFFNILDLARNAVTSIWWRYFIFNTIPLILVISYFLANRISSGKLLQALIYTGLVVVGLFSVITISNERYWYLGGEWANEFVDNAALFSEPNNVLLITDFTRDNNPWTGPTLSMQVLANTSSDNIDILRLNSSIDNIEDLIPTGRYSDVYVFYTSWELRDHLFEQFGERMEEVAIHQGPPIWKISF